MFRRYVILDALALYCEFNNLFIMLLLVFAERR